jgi:hypothetical protein
MTRPPSRGTQSDVGEKSSVIACLACKHVANIQDITRHHRRAPDGTKRAADLD